MSREPGIASGHDITQHISALRWAQTPTLVFTGKAHVEAEPLHDKEYGLSAY